MFSKKNILAFGKFIFWTIYQSLVIMQNFAKYRPLFKEKNMQAKLPIYPSQPPSFFIPKNGHPIFLKLKAFQFRKKGWSRPKFVGKKILPICFVCNLVWLHFFFLKGQFKAIIFITKTDKKGYLLLES